MTESFATEPVAFLFTDIEGSTALWEARPDAMRIALARHDALVRAAIEGQGGTVFKTVGDAFCAAFDAAPAAAAAALAAQRALRAERWPDGAALRVRIALHAGPVERRDGDYFGPPVNRVARLCAAAHGGQTLVSGAAADGCRDALPEGATLQSLGAHRLKDLARAEAVHELRCADLPDTFPPIRSLSTHPNNLPPQLTAFVGRERALADVAGLLAQHRLLTLTGAGGCGKTRLALQAAAEALAGFPDGAWFVDLAPLADPALLPQAVATALSVVAAPGVTVADALAAHLRERRLLLVLDNCEHVIDAAAALADALLRAAPALAVMTTSRESLGLAGEQRYRVPSLSLPPAVRVPALDDVLAAESARLFVDRAQLARPEFRVAAGEAATLASICVRLDGIPLALELAAANVVALTLPEIDARLDQRFRLLTGGARTARPRHQTLRALIDWSWGLLDAGGQRLFRRLAIFAGGFTLAAAEGLCDDDDAVAQGLAALANKSLVVFDADAPRPRYRLAETVRQYAREKLEASGELARLRTRHADVLLRFAEEAAAGAAGAAQATWLARLDDERDNLRAALEACLAEGRASEALRLCFAQQRFWVTRGFFAEGRECCRRALALPGAQTQTRERGNVLHESGALAYYRSEFDAARAAFEASLAIREAIDDRAGIAASLNALGNVAIELGDWATAQGWHERSLAVALAGNDRPAIANAHVNLGILRIKHDDAAGARGHYEASLAMWRALGDQRGIAGVLNNLGDVAFFQGDEVAARAYQEEALVLRRAIGDRRGIGLAQINLAHLAYAQRDWPAATTLAAASAALCAELGERRQLTHALAVAGGVAAARGEPLRAATLWGGVAALCAAVGSPTPGVGREELDDLARAARAACADPAAFDRAHAEGRGLGIDALAALAQPADGTA